MRVTRLLLVLALLCAVPLLGGNARPVHAAPVFTVNSTQDFDDAVNDGVCETSTPGQCTFRAAMHEVENGGGGTINFNISGCPCTIISFGPYFTTKPVVID